MSRAAHDLRFDLGEELAVEFSDAAGTWRVISRLAAACASPSLTRRLCSPFGFRWREH